jgi:hypothetical protein
VFVDFIGMARLDYMASSISDINTKSLRAQHSIPYFVSTSYSYRPVVVGVQDAGAARNVIVKCDGDHYFMTSVNQY